MSHEDSPQKCSCLYIVESIPLQDIEHQNMLAGTPSYVNLLWGKDAWGVWMTVYATNEGIAEVLVCHFLWVKGDCT